ncbi:MAG: hypothetical protein HYV09_41160 [Deltaproteobacteria bacterium]|nr:hypothetical protein [Deltaproteobacteria bacterium]
MRTLGRCAAIFIAASSVTGCGSDPAAPAADAGVDVTEVGDTARPDTGVADTGTPDTGSTGGDHGGTTGKPCSTNDECDVTGDGVNMCSIDWYALGSLYPDPVCFGTECAPPEPGSIAACDDGKGWCIDYESGVTRCFAQCHFDTDRETAATGCIGKNACNFHGWTKDEGGPWRGTGYCFGGCTADADCPSGHKCQTEWGECVLKAKHWVATKAVGEPCTSADRGTSTKPPTCSCWMSISLGKGYCTEFCKVGDSPSSCPDGFTCDALLPDSEPAPFTAAAKGLAGVCTKNCTDDSECVALGAYCERGAGMPRKTCQFGSRPGGPVDAGVGDASDSG